jgi:hypothetical protein
MGLLGWSWLGSAAVMVGLAALIGQQVRGDWLGIFIDRRNRYSLSQFQIVLWTIVALPLVVAVAITRAGKDGLTAWDFVIPGELLALMGVSISSTVIASVTKNSDDARRDDSIGARRLGVRPSFYDLFTYEDGEDAFTGIDVTKFQNFVLTIALALSYVWSAASMFADVEPGKVPTALPAMSEAMVGLLLISHGGYIAGKLPKREGLFAEGDRITLAQLKQSKADRAATSLPPPGG